MKHFASWQNARGLYFKRAAALLCAFVMIPVLFFIPVFSCSSQAMNVDYLDQLKWSNNSNVTFEEIETGGLGKELFGVFGYYVDSEMCIYTYFSVTETNIDYYAENVIISYVFNVAGEEYTVGVGVDGEMDSSPEAKKLFNAESNFSDAKNGRYLSAVQYLGKEKSISADVYFYVNKRYIIKNNITIEIPETTALSKETTTKSSTTKRAGSTSSAKTKTEKTTASTAQKTTKYTPKGTVSSRAGTDAETTFLPEPSNADTEEEEEEEYAVEQSVSKEETRSNFARAMIIGGAAFAAVGAALVIIYSVSQKRSVLTENEEE